MKQERKNQHRGVSLRRAFAVVAIAAGACALAPAAEATPAGEPPVERPRPVSAAERAALELLLRYAEGGAEALAGRLAADSPLGKLDRVAATAEIAARLGPASGARWRLETAPPSSSEAYFGIEFPSGVEEIVALTVRPGPEARLVSIRSLADTAPAVSAIAGVAVSEWPAGAGPGGLAWALPPVLLIALAAARGGSRSSRRALAVLLVAAGCAGDRERGEVEAPGAARLSLAPLAGLRAALAAGESAAQVASEAALRIADPAVARVRDLWLAQHALLAGDVARARSLLAAPPGRAEPPLADYLRSRLAAFELRVPAAIDALERVRDAGFETESILLEIYELEAWSAASVGRASVSPLTSIGARGGAAWYAAARNAAFDSNWDGGERLFRLAWAQEPLTRAAILDDSALAALAARPELFALLEPGSPEEPRVEPPADVRTPPLAFDGEAVRCGHFLRLQAGTGGAVRVDVPGGGALVPARTIDAVELERRDEREAELETRSLLAGGATRDLELTPRLLRAVERAFPALLRERKWAEVEQLSRPFLAGLERVSGEIAMARAMALVRLEREAEARSLLLDFAKIQIEARRPAPTVLYSLADLHSRAGDYETASRLVRKADAQLRRPVGERRLRLFELARSLADDSEVHRTGHFDIRFPRATGESYPRDLGKVLEEERLRLLRFAPARDAQRVQVELFGLEDFLRAFEGDVAVIGVYDGRLRVPLADLRTLRPEVVAIVSHELLHALLADATRDGAPRWFQEGLAQWVETGTLHVNPYPDLDAKGRIIAFPLIESILSGFAEPVLVELAYSEAHWAVDFVASRFGERGLRVLVDEFRAGADTERAIAALAGWSVAEFDRELRAWATSRAPAQRRIEARRFDRMEGTLFERASGDGAPGPDARPLRESPRRPADLGPAMARWYEEYRRLSTPIRTAYAPILRTLDTHAGAPRKGECEALQEALDGIQAPGALAAAPDGKVETRLRNLVGEMNRLASDCALERFDAMRVDFDRVGRAMNAAAEAMAPYGLRP
jgi:hypothetical protein